MSRWEPNSQRRLQEAALALIAERGFESTTAAEIAYRAGLTERTFFRHFGDKREVLFANEDAMQEALVGAVTSAPPALAPLDAIAKGLEAVGMQLQPRREFLRQRATIVAAHPALQERELIKLASTAKALADALRQRDVAAPAAKLAAEVSIAVLRVAFERWIDEAEGRELPELIAEALNQLELFAARTEPEPNTHRGAVGRRDLPRS